jgi:hypothetical protein
MCRRAFDARAASPGTWRALGLSLLLAAFPSPAQAQIPTGGSCPPDPSHPDRGSVSGRVLDSSIGVPIGRVEVSLVPEVPGETDTTRADGGGRFLFCSVAPGRYTLRGVFPGFGEAEATVTVEAGGRASQNLSLVFHDAGRKTGTLRGMVVAAESGQPLPLARVTIGQGEEARMSGEDGSFEFSDVPIGPLTLTASLFGYADAHGGVVMGGGQTLDLEVRLSPRPIELEPIVVEAVSLDIGDGMLADVRRRADWGWGTVLLTEELEDRTKRASRTTDILQEYGARVTGIRETDRSLSLRRAGCGPTVYVDGIKLTRGSRAGGGGGVESAQAANLVHPMDIAAIEIYRGPAETPGEFLDSNSQCGVILLWTRRGGDKN